MARRKGISGRAWRSTAIALVAGLASLAPAQTSLAQSPPATLIADDIAFEQGTETITARGGVEIFFDGSRLRAEAVSYTGAGDRIAVEGPLTLVDESGNTVVVAEFGDLSADLQDGVMQSARVVLNRQMQIAASRVDRVDGRYTQAYQAVASSCSVCADNPTPLWEVRARTITHDQEERQLYFEHAQFRILGIPVLWLPQMRFPDPSLERATGFLTPSIRAASNTGVQIQVPYFITLGDHADLTVTPWLGLGDSQTIELGYRQAFRNGRVQANGSITFDDLTDDDVRGHIFASGAFDLPADFKLSFTAQSVTDDAYLSAYGFPSPNLLQNAVRVTRTEMDRFIDFGLTSYSSLRDGDVDDTLPTQVGDGVVIQRFVPGMLGGVAELRFNALGYIRPEDSPGTGFNDRPLATDAARLSAVLDWRRSEILRNGAVISFETALAADFITAQQDVDPSLNDSETRLTPYAALELRYPMRRRGENGVTHLLEPVVQLAWSESWGEDGPLEDSAIVGFDEGNLLALDRFPGSDRREEGQRAAIGLGYTRMDDGGWSVGGTAGVILRAEDMMQFTQGSGLDGRTSDYLLASHVSYADRLRVVNRALFDGDFDFTSNELAVTFNAANYAIGSTYTWLESDPAEDRFGDTGELALNANYQFENNWDTAVSWRYDFVDQSARTAVFKVGYETECLDMSVNVSRLYSGTSAIDDTTEFSFSIGLNGIGGREGRSRARTCRN